MTARGRQSYRLRRLHAEQAILARSATLHRRIRRIRLTLAAAALALPIAWALLGDTP